MRTWHLEIPRSLDEDETEILRAALKAGVETGLPFGVQLLMTKGWICPKCHAVEDYHDTGAACTSCDGEGLGARVLRICDSEYRNYPGGCFRVLSEADREGHAWHRTFVGWGEDRYRLKAGSSGVWLAGQYVGRIEHTKEGSLEELRVHRIGDGSFGVVRRAKAITLDDYRYAAEWVHPGSWLMLKPMLLHPLLDPPR